RPSPFLQAEASARISRPIVTALVLISAPEGLKRAAHGLRGRCPRRASKTHTQPHDQRRCCDSTGRGPEPPTLVSWPALRSRLEVTLRNKALNRRLIRRLYGSLLDRRWSRSFLLARRNRLSSRRLANTGRSRFERSWLDAFACQTIRCNL